MQVVICRNQKGRGYYRASSFLGRSKAHGPHGQE
jgi:hypothetical protein